jgi:hypothetical protein
VPLGKLRKRLLVDRSSRPGSDDGGFRHSTLRCDKP